MSNRLTSLAGTDPLSMLYNISPPARQKPNTSVGKSRQQIIYENAILQREKSFDSKSKNLDFEAVTHEKPK